MTLKEFIDIVGKERISKVHSYIETKNGIHVSKLSVDEAFKWDEIQRKVNNPNVTPFLDKGIWMIQPSSRYEGCFIVKL